MSTKNRTYSIKLVLTNLIKKVFERTYNQLPLSDITYPFAVMETFVLDDCPSMKIEVTIDLWGLNTSESTALEFQSKIDELINVLDFINYTDGSISLSGQIDTVQDVVTQEEELLRIQIKATYDILKVG